MSSGNAAEVGTKISTLKLGGPGDMSIRFPEGKVRVMPFGGRRQVLRYLFPLRYLWSVASLREPVVVDQMWVGLVSAPKIIPEIKFRGFG